MTFVENLVLLVTKMWKRQLNTDFSHFTSKVRTFACSRVCLRLEAWTNVLTKTGEQRCVYL